MKVATRLLAATAVLEHAVNSNALKSSIRGDIRPDADVELASRLSERRTLHPDYRHMNHEGRRQEETSPYWWLGKQSSEKDVVYKSNKAEQGTTRANNGKDSFSVFTIDIDNNPDTSDLPYRAPSKKPTDKPTSAPTTNSPSSPPTETVTIQRVSPQNIVSYSAQRDINTYYFPVWIDTFKGCVSSPSVPPVYKSFPDEYLFSSITSCCQSWFDSDDCSDSDGIALMTSTEEEYDEYMFRMNGVQAYSGGGDSSSKDFSSNDGPRPSPVPPSTPETPPPVAEVSGTPTYTPTGDKVTVFPNITSPELPASTPTPTPGVVTMYTPYPTFVPVPTSTVTQPPVFEVVAATDMPTAGGSVVIGGDTPYPTFSALTTVANTAPPVFEVVASTSAPTTSGSLQGTIESTMTMRTAETKEKSKATRLFLSHAKLSENNN